MTRHIKQWRFDQFEEIKTLISGYQVVGIGDLENFPAALLHKLRKKLPDVKFKVTNRNVLKRVLDALDHKDLLDILPRQPIIILTNDNAFELYANIKKSKAKSKAKVGMVSPIDIMIPEGDTGLPPGPALSDLKKVGLKAQVKGPTIHITKDAVVTKQGEVINEDVVSTLSKLDIKPIELILEVCGVKEDGLVYNKEVLNVDADDIFDQFTIAVRSGINLGVEIGYATDLTIEPLIMSAELKAKALQSEVDSKSASDKPSEEKSSEVSSENKTEEKVEEKKE